MSPPHLPAPAPPPEPSPHPSHDTADGERRTRAGRSSRSDTSSSAGASPGSSPSRASRSWTFSSREATTKPENRPAALSAGHQPQGCVPLRSPCRTMVSSVSSQAASNRSAMAASQPLRDAKAPRKLPDLRQNREIERPPRFRLRRGFVISTKSVIGMTACPPAVTPLRKQTARELRDMLGKHQVVLKADADPERDADNQALQNRQVVLPIRFA